MPVEIVHWNPNRPTFSGRWGRRLPLRRPVNNFGDLIGPIIVNELLGRAGLTNEGTGRLLTVGSVVHLSQPGDTVWGSGVNGKVDSLGGAPALDVRAVRGPETRARLVAAGVPRVPETYGDPALLWGHLWPRESYLASSDERFQLTVIPNLHDYPALKDQAQVVSPRSQLSSLIARIARSEFVVGSSLHGIILAESFGVPSRLVRSATEPLLKYVDYYAGSGRPTFTVAESLEQAVSMGGENGLQWDPEPLLAAFPYDLFH